MWGRLFGVDPKVTLTVNSSKNLEEYRDTVLKRDHPIVLATDKVTGKYELILPEDCTCPHYGIFIQLVGEFKRPGDPTVIQQFFQKRQELVPSGTLSTSLRNDFVFERVVFPTYSYFGNEIDAIYSIQLYITHAFINCVTEVPILVINFDDKTDEDKPVSHQFGISNVMHVEIVFPHKFVTCKGCIIGEVYFGKSMIRIEKITIMLFRMEKYLSSEFCFQNNVMLKEWEIMDGVPVRGEHIPIRLYLNDVFLFPYTKFQGSNLTVKHFAKIRLIDENDRCYYKTLKISFVRLKPDNLSTLL